MPHLCPDCGASCLCETAIDADGYGIDCEHCDDGLPASDFEEEL